MGHARLHAHYRPTKSQNYICLSMAHPYMDVLCNLVESLHLSITAMLSAVVNSWQAPTVDSEKQVIGSPVLGCIFGRVSHLRVELQYKVHRLFVFSKHEVNNSVQPQLPHIIQPFPSEMFP